ncbi:MAG: ATP-binding cassette domain-containing protein [Planctomycetia bacterium]|nr:ATP-binding cassette domain-containing protein [Planctomycetia bacterium]
MNHRLIATFERRYPGGPAIKASLRLPMNAFSVTALIGPSGCGKTTVLRCLAGLDPPEQGTITCGDDVWFDASRGIHASPQRRGIGFLFQEYALFPHLTLFENIAYGLAHESASEIGRRVGELTAMLQIAGLESRYPRELSGGQQQRAALARTVAPRPKLLLLDEPLSALDTPTRVELRRELRGVLAALEIPTIIVTHDPVEVTTLADHVIVLEGGQILQQGPVPEVFAKPNDPRVARIIGLK